MPSLEELLAYDVDAPPEPAPEPEPVAASEPETKVTAVAATAPPPRVPTVGEKAIQAQSAATAPLGMQGAMMTPPKQRSPLEELLGADSAEEAERQMIDNPEFNEFDYYAKYKESDPNAKAFMLRTNEERAARGFKTPDGKDYPHYKDPSMTVGDAFEGAADFMFGVPEQFYNVVEQRVLEHKGHPNAQRSAAQYTLGGQTMGKNLDALVEKTPFAPAKPQVYGEYVMKTPRGYLLDSESKPIPAKIAQWEAALPTVADRIKYAEERGGATGEEFGEVINGKAGLLRSGFAKLKAGNPNLTPEENEQLKVLAIEVEKEDAAKAKASYEKALRQQKVEAKGEDAWERRQLANAIPLDTGTIAENYKARYGILPSRDLGPAALKQAGADPVDEGVVRRMAAVGDPMNLGLTYLKVPMAVPGARTTGGAIARGVGYLGEKTAALAEKVLESKIGKGAAGIAGGYGLVNLFNGDVEKAAKTGLGLATAWGLKKLGVASKALNEYGKEVMTGGKYVAPLTTKVAQRAAETASDPWFVRTAKNAGGALKMKGLEAFVQAAGAPVGMSGLNLIFSGGDPQTFGALSAVAPMWGLWGFHGGVKPQLVNALRPQMQKGGKAYIDAQRAATNDPWSHKSAEFIEKLPEEQRNRTYEMVDAFVGQKTKAENGQEGVSDLLVLPANEYAAYKAEHNLPAGPERAITMHNGRAIVNGEHYSLLGKEGESNYRHTLGHEVGTHVPMAIARAMTGPGSPLHTNIINGLKKELMPGGKPRPDYLKFVDHYNREAAKSGEPPKSPEEMIEEYMAGTSGRFFEMKSAADLAIPDGISESIQDVLDSNFGALAGLPGLRDPREVGGTGYFDHKERGRATALVTDFMRQIVSPENRATQRVDPSAMPPVPPAPAPGSVKPPGWQSPAPGGAIPPTPPIVPHVPAAPGAAAPVAAAPARPLQGPEAGPVPENAQRWAIPQPAAALEGLQWAQPQPAGRAALQLSGEKPSGAPEGGGAPENAPNAPESSPSAGNQPSGGAARVQIAPEPGADPSIRRAPVVTMPPRTRDDDAADQLIRASKNRTQAAMDIAHQAAKASGNDALFQRRVDPYTGDVSYKGRIDLNRPEHRALIRQLKLTPKELSHLMAAQDAFTGQERYVDYWSASKEKDEAGQPTTDITGKQRRREYINDKGKTVRELLQTNKGIVFMGLEVTPNGKVVHRGLSTDKLVSNIAKLIGAAKAAGIKVDYADINDPQIRQDVESILKNYDNGYTADGSQLFRDPATGEEIPAKPNTRPEPVDRDRADLINAAMHFDVTQKPWEHAQKKVANEQARAEQNFDERKAAGLLEPGEKKIRKTKKNVAPQVATKAKESQAYAQAHDRAIDAETGDVNKFRALVNKSGQLSHENEKGEVRKGTGENLESVWEDLRPDYIEDMRMSPSDAPRTVRDVGLDPKTRTGEFLPNASRINWRALPANLMPTGGEPTKGGRVKAEYDPSEGTIYGQIGEEGYIDAKFIEPRKYLREFGISPNGLSGKNVAIDGLWVENADRSKGLGTDAVNEVISKAREAGADRVIAVTSDGSLVDFYKRLGFTEGDSNQLGQTLVTRDLKTPGANLMPTGGEPTTGKKGALREEVITPARIQAVSDEALKMYEVAANRTSDHNHLSTVISRTLFPFSGTRVRAPMARDFEPWKKAMADVVASLPEGADFSNVQKAFPGGTKMDIATAVRRAHDIARTAAIRSSTGDRGGDTSGVSRDYLNMLEILQTDFSSPIPYSAVRELERITYPQEARESLPEPKAVLRRPRPPKVTGEGSEEVSAYLPHEPGALEGGGKYGKWQTQEAMDAAKAALPEHHFSNTGNGYREGEIELRLPDGEKIGYISWTRQSDGDIHLDGSHIAERSKSGVDLRNKGYGEALYREMARQVQKLGGEKLVSGITSEKAIKARRRIFDTPAERFLPDRSARAALRPDPDHYYGDIHSEIHPDVHYMPTGGDPALPQGERAENESNKTSRPAAIRGALAQAVDTGATLPAKSNEPAQEATTKAPEQGADQSQDVGPRDYSTDDWYGTITGGPESGERFHRAIKEGVVGQKHGAAVTVKDLAEYQHPEYKLILAHDDSAGVAVTPEKDLVSVFKKTGSKTPVRKLLNEAVNQGAKTLDGYDINGSGFLQNLYQDVGFRPTGKLKWNAEYAPDGWNEKVSGQPDLVLMVHDPEGKLGLPTGDYNEIRNDVPVYDDYEKAISARDALQDKLDEPEAQANLMPTGGEPTEPGKKGALRKGFVGAGALEAERKKGALRGQVRGVIDELKKKAALRDYEISPEDWPEEVRGALSEKGGKAKAERVLGKDYRISDPGDREAMPIRQVLVDGQPKLTNGDPVYITEDYKMVDSPAIKNYKGPGPEDATHIDWEALPYDVAETQKRQIEAAIESGAVDWAAREMERQTRELIKNPEIAAGMGWYGRMRENLLRELGEEGRELFSQLLGATSAKTPVPDNFLQAVDAYEGIQQKKYEREKALYHEMVGHEKAGKLNDVIAERGQLDVLNNTAEALETEALGVTGKKQLQLLHQAKQLRKLADKPVWTGGGKKIPTGYRSVNDSRAIWEFATKMLPLKRNGQKFNANSGAVLKVIVDEWLDNRNSPKTPNFAGNMSGRTLQATIDVWAARYIRQLLYKGHTNEPWRIQPKSEGSVSNHDFALGQEIMKRAAKHLKMNPDDLQAVLWYAEKHNWDANGWTGAAGAEKVSFDEMFHLFFPEGKPRLTYEQGKAELDRMKAEEVAQKEAELAAEAESLGISVPQLKKKKAAEKKQAKQNRLDENEADYDEEE